jgi:hypothetical protein
MVKRFYYYKMKHLEGIVLCFGREKGFYAGLNPV